jgi:DNA-directed RNA polymerase specialized sigma24 family protein
MEGIGSSRGLDEPMTTHQTAIDLLTHDLDLRSRSSVSKTTLARLRKLGLDLPPETRVRDLAAICHGLIVIPGVDREQVITALFKLAPTDETAGVTALVAMRPALLRVAIRVSGSSQPSADTVAEILALAWEHLASATKHDLATPCSLVRFVWSKARTVTRRERTLSRRTEALDEDFDTEGDESTDDSLMTSFLGMAVDRGVLTHVDAELIWLTIVIGFDMKELASIWGVSHSMLKQRRLTAMTALRGYTRDLLEVL